MRLCLRLRSHWLTISFSQPLVPLATLLHRQALLLVSRACLENSDHLGEFPRVLRCTNHPVRFGRMLQRTNELRRSVRCFTASFFDFFRSSDCGPGTFSPQTGATICQGCGDFVLYSCPPLTIAVFMLSCGQDPGADRTVDVRALSRGPVCQRRLPDCLQSSARVLSGPISFTTCFCRFRRCSVSGRHVRQLDWIHRLSQLPARHFHQQSRLIDLLEMRRWNGQPLRWPDCVWQLRCGKLLGSNWPGCLQAVPAWPQSTADGLHCVRQQPAGHLHRPIWRAHAYSMPSRSVSVFGRCCQSQPASSVSSLRTWRLQEPSRIRPARRLAISAVKAPRRLCLSLQCALHVHRSLSWTFGICDFTPIASRAPSPPVNAIRCALRSAPASVVTTC